MATDLGGYGARDAADDREQRAQTSRGLGTGIGRHSAGLEPGSGRDANWRWQKLAVHATRVDHPPWGDRGSSAVNSITRGHGPAVLAAQYIMRGVGEPSAGRSSIHCTRHAGIGYYGGFHDVFKPPAAMPSA